MFNCIIYLSGVVVIVVGVVIVVVVVCLFVCWTLSTARTQTDFPTRKLFFYFNFLFHILVLVSHHHFPTLPQKKERE